MTDKQMEEKIDGFMEDIAMYVHYFHTDPDIDTDQVSYKRDMKAIRIRIEELVEEVEREGYEQGYQNSETKHDWAKGKDVKNVWFKPNN